MAQCNTYQSNAAEIPIMRKWLICALVISLLIHAGLLIFFNFKRLENFGYSDEERLAPPIHIMQQVTLPADVPETKPDVPVNKPLPAIVIPQTKPEVSEINIAPSAPEMTTPIVQEKPKVDLSGFDALEKMPSSSQASLDKQLRQNMTSLMDKSTRMSNQPVIHIRAGEKGGDGTGAFGGIPGRDTLDGALARATGPLSNRPVAMQGGALFEWGKAELQPGAVDNLRKLGELIKRYPKSNFVISGHTDHTGTHDINLQLSQQRADAVRDWLVANFGIDPTRITTIGKADDEAFPNLGPEKSIDEQAPNRRVEIVIKTKGK